MWWHQGLGEGLEGMYRHAWAGKQLLMPVGFGHLVADTSPNLTSYKVLGFNSARGRVEKKRIFKSIISAFETQLFDVSHAMTVEVLVPWQQVAWQTEKCSTPNVLSFSLCMHMYTPCHLSLQKEVFLC